MPFKRIEVTLKSPKTRGVREPENVGSSRDKNFSRDRDFPRVSGFLRMTGFPKVSELVLLGLIDVCTSENQQCLYTLSYDALNV